MPLILNIDTAGENAVISISNEEKVLAFVTNKNQKDHASFMHTAVKQLSEKAGIALTELNAVAVVSGPGSYTGLRVGMAGAKGFCYALQIPMITIPALELMATVMINKTDDKNALYCPMIDARRMEIFTAVYDAHLTEIIKPVAMIIDENSFNDLLTKNKIYFTGSGVEKFKKTIINANAFFINDEVSPEIMAALSYKSYLLNQFADVAYAAPFYLKEFYTAAKPD